MDPDAARTKMIEKANEVLGLAGNAATSPHPEKDLVQVVRAGVELAETVHGLDEWLRMRGFLPRAWAVGGGATGSIGQQGRKQDVSI